MLPWDLAICCRFSLEAAGCKPARGTGSRDRRGMALGLGLDWSMVVMMVMVMAKGFSPIKN